MSSEVMNLEAILAEARQKAGLDDFGPTDFLPGLQQLIQSYETPNVFDEGQTEKGRRRAKRRLVDLLAARLRIEAALKRHPEIRDIQIKQPMFLTGLPRTGTSALLNLLANDPVSRPLRLWEGLNPDPLPDFVAGQPDPRHVAMKQFYDDMNAKDPNFSKIHATSADTPEECIHLLNHTFQDAQFGVETMMQPYDEWFQQLDKRPSYDYYADLLRMLQWQRPGPNPATDEGTRWLLKTPAHLWALDILVDLFPDCAIIITHRNPLECVTSYASMMAALMPERINLDKTKLGPVVMEYLARKMEASLQAREKIDPKRIIDIQFNDFISDSLGVVHRIYQHFDLPMPAATAQAMATYAAEHPMGKHGKHEYKLAEYGLSETQVKERFGFYIERFAVPMD